jgi:hypothetical protein
MSVHPRLAAALSAGAVALLTPAAGASPWTLPRGTIVFQGTFQYQTANREFFERGPSRSFPLDGRYVGNTFTLGLRVGITDRLELDIALPIRTVAYTSDPVVLAEPAAGSMQSAADFYRRNIINLSRTATGIGDLYLSARYRLALRPFAFAVGLRVKAPTGYVGPSGTFGDRPQSAAEFAMSPERYTSPENVRDDVTLGDGQLDLMPELLLGYAFRTRTFLRADLGFNGRFGGAGQQVVGALRAGQSVGAAVVFYAWAQAYLSVTDGRVIGVSVAAENPDLPAAEYLGTRNLLLRDLRLERDLVEVGVGAIVRIGRDVELNLGYSRGLWGRNVALTDSLFASIGVRAQVPGLQ